MQTAPATHAAQPASLPAVIYDSWQPRTAADYTQRFAETHRNLLYGSWLEARIPALFRTTALHERTARFLRFGGERPYDPYILEMIVEMLSAKREEPLKILEIGAGTTWGAGSEWGAPWFARSLQLAFGTRVRVTASDLGALPRSTSASSLMFYTFHDSPLLHLMECSFSFDEDASRHSIWNESTGSFIPLNKTSENGEEPFNALASTFHRPSHDGFIERAVFGLHYAAGPAWDYFDLTPETTPGAPYDFIFGRMLLPMSDLGGHHLLRSVRSILAEGGAYFIHVDRQPPLVGP